MVFAEGVKLYILDDDHLLVVLVEHGRAQYLLGVEVVAVGEEKHGFGNALGALEESFTFEVLAEETQDGLVVSGQFGDTGVVVFVYLLVS